MIVKTVTINSGLRGLGQLMCRAFKLVGSGGLHTLRQMFASRYLEAGGKLKDQQKLRSAIYTAMTSS